jgi:hypothetical protein
MYLSAWFSGHDFIDELTDHPALVTVSKCEVCGHYEISWRELEK